jgi:small-conductance mechanosensitive channel
MRNIKEKTEAAGLTIPFPQRDLHIIPPATAGQTKPPEEPPEKPENPGEPAGTR